VQGACWSASSRRLGGTTPGDRGGQQLGELGPGLPGEVGFPQSLLTRGQIGERTQGAGLHSQQLGQPPGGLLIQSACLGGLLLVLTDTGEGDFDAGQQGAGIESERCAGRSGRLGRGNQLPGGLQIGAGLSRLIECGAGQTPRQQSLGPGPDQTGVGTIARRFRQAEQRLMAASKQPSASS